MTASGNGPADLAVVRSPGLRLAPGDLEATGGDLLRTLLDQQQSLTAVERFAAAHESCEAPAQAKYYRSLIPLQRPQPGQQYAFEVDLDACTGCKACVAGCHSLNGLDDNEMWRQVGLLHGGTREAPAQQTVTTSCHHCVDPACMKGCPVKAYEKDAVTGIVKHLDDQCIGCQYCMLMCPYDAPKYSPSRGIVRKCDMCSDRLAVDEAPACVQACPSQAIRIKVIDQQQAIQASEAGTFLPGAPAPDHTIPTTVYTTAKPVARNMLPADFYRVDPEHSHPALVVMLVLTQLAVGTFVTDFVARRLFGVATGAASWPLLQAAISLSLAFVAIGAATFHLGRPQYAFRALLGLRTSWMSREILAFGLFAMVYALYALSLVPTLLPALPGVGILLSLRGVWEAAALTFGVAGIACSVMIYAATRRAHWGAGATGFKFFTSAAMQGAAAVHALAAVLLASGHEAPFARPAVAERYLLATVAVLTTLKLLFEASTLTHLRGRQHTVAKRMALLLVGELKTATSFRYLAATVGGLVIPVFWGEFPDDRARAIGAAAMFVCLLSGEFIERYLFFKAAPPSRMPGGLN